MFLNLFNVKWPYKKNGAKYSLFIMKKFIEVYSWKVIILLPTNSLVGSNSIALL